MICRPFRFASGVISLVLFFAILQSCTGLEKFDKKRIDIDGRAGRVSVTAELAVTAAQHQQGLMHRKELKDGDAMLFIFERDHIMSFWMKDTLIPLSIAYIASDGKILEIYDMEPGDLNPVNSGRSVRYALEVPQGWFSRAGIGIGDVLNLAGL